MSITNPTTKDEAYTFLLDAWDHIMTTKPNVDTWEECRADWEAMQIIRERSRIFEAHHARDLRCK